MAEQMGKNRARFTLEELGEAFNEQWRVQNNWHLEGVVTDSRQAQNGNIFFAIKGEHFDGHKFLPQVARIPKIVAFYDQDTAEPVPDCFACAVPDTVEALGQLARFHRQRFEIPIVAVTGSYGKTSTRALIHAALCAGGETLTSQANFNNEIGVPMTLFQLEERHQAAVLEMGMRGAGQIDYLAKIAEPSVGVITNIGPQHIELLETIENIAGAKAELIENLPAEGLAVLPADSPFLGFLKSKAPCRFVTFGASENADYRVAEVKTDEGGNVSFSVRVNLNDQNGSGATALFQSEKVEASRLEEGGSPAPNDLAAATSKVSIKLPLPGAHNATNAAAAFAVAHQLGVAPDAIVAALQKAQLPGARMRVISTETLTIIDDCYNAGPDSMRAALETLRDFPTSGRRVAVLGAMRELGAHSDAEHRKLGALASEICDVVIGVGSETEPMMDALGDALRAGAKCQIFGWSPDAKQSLELVEARVKDGDVILVKGSRNVGLEVVVEALK